jgi:hypothetical protein
MLRQLQANEQVAQLLAAPALKHYCLALQKMQTKCPSRKAYDL